MQKPMYPKGNYFSIKKVKKLKGGQGPTRGNPTPKPTKKVNAKTRMMMNNDCF